jgi:hypothetical protein
MGKGRLALKYASEGILVPRVTKATPVRGNTRKSLSALGNVKLPRKKQGGGKTPPHVSTRSYTPTRRNPCKKCGMSCGVARCISQSSINTGKFSCYVTPDLKGVRSIDAHDFF